MKKIITFVLVALASVASFAANITCAEAVSIAQGLEPNTPSTETYTVEGYVISVIKPSATDLRFWMADSLNVEAGIFEAWMCTGEVVKKGDKVTVTGNLQWYVNLNNPNEQMAEIYGGTVVIVEAAPIDENYVEFYPFDFEGEGVSGTGGEISVTKNGVTVYTNGGYGSPYSLRVYRNKQLKISSTKRIVSIAFEFDNYDGDYSGGLDPEVCVGGTEWEVTAIASLGRFKKIAVTLGDGECGITPVVDIITVAQAIEIGNALEDGGKTTETYVVEAFVVKAYDFDEEYKNQSFYMSDDATAEHSDFFAKYTTGDVVVEGDKVQVKGKIEKYVNSENGTTTIQIYKGVATVVPQYTITLYTDMTKGSVSGAGKYIKGDICTLTATANYGYHFTQWNDGNTDNPRKVIVTQDTSFTAEFAKNSYSFEVKANDDERGSVEGTNGTYEYQTELTVSATARLDLGYHFAQWSDGNTDNPRILTLTENTVLVAQFEENQCGDDLMWYLKDNELLITGTGAIYDYYPWFISWSSWASQITSISLPEGLTHIGTNAFMYCYNVQKIEIPTTVTSIGSYAFQGCSSLTSITIPNSVTTIGGAAFDGCTGLKGVYITNLAAWCKISFGNLTANPLYYAHNLYLNNELVMDLAIPNSVTEIGDYAFSGCSLSSITIPNSVTTIGYGAFAECERISTVTFGSGLWEIGDYAFSGDYRIADITCYAEVTPTIYTYTFEGITKKNVYLYVPENVIRRYQIDPYWNEFDIRTKSADVKPMDDENPVVTPSDQDVTITWPITDGTDTYTLTITKNGEVVCVLTFNANGQLTNIAFAAPGHNGARQAPAATLTAQGYQFTVTGLNPGTAYDYSVTATDASGQTLAEHKGNFSTTGGTGFKPVRDSQCTMHKYFHNGNLIIERNGVKYTPAGQKVQ